MNARVFASGLGAAALVLSSAEAAQAPAVPRTVQCFDVIAPATDSASWEAIKIDKCEGTSWILVRTRDPATAGQPASFVWRWHQLTNDPSEAHLIDNTVR